MTQPASNTVNVLVMAPMLGNDFSFISDVNPRVRVIDGSGAYLGEIQAQGARMLGASPDVGSIPPQEERDDLLARAQVILMAYPVLSRVASRAPNLRWVHHTQAGASNFWNSDLWASQVTLTSSRGFVAPTSIAQYVITSALFFARGLYDAYLDKLSGQLDRSHYQGTRLEGATMGIVGLGGIGKEVARLAHLLSMRVVATRRSAQSAQQNVDGADLLLPTSRLNDLAAQSDFLAICAALTQETEGVINRRVFEVMKPASVLINVSRGETVNEGDLVEALQNGRIRGAVMDVFQGELEGKQPRKELMELPNAFITSHIASTGFNSSDTVRGLFRDNLRRFLDGEPLLNEVDRARGY